jgi:hypothetical protein
MKKAENYRNGEQISGCRGLKKRWGQEGIECGYERTALRTLVVIVMIFS